MGSVLVIASSKGGVGKTCLTTLLSTHMASSGYRVAVVDADRNQAFAAWHRSAEAPPMNVTSCIDHNEIVRHAMEQGAKHDVTVIDTAGFENQTAIFAMGTADMVLIPSMADRNSVIEAVKTAGQVGSVSQIARREIPYRVVLTRWRSRELAERATVDDIDTAKLPRLQSTVADLSEFRKYTFSGVAPSGSAIETLASRLVDEIRGLGAIPPRPKRKKEAA